MVSATDGTVASPPADLHAFDKTSQTAMAFAGGVSCDDGDPCTIDECTPAGCTHTPVTCAAADQCHEAATCDPATGLCASPAKPDGAACNDANARTQTDTCHRGVCTGTNPVTCAAADQCQDAATCDPATGLCLIMMRRHPRSTLFPYASPHRSAEYAPAGSAHTPVTCAAADQCHEAATCDPATGLCASPAKPD